jgi:hypothetical protein
VHLRPTEGNVNQRANVLGALLVVQFRQRSCLRGLDFMDRFLEQLGGRNIHSERLHTTVQEGPDSRVYHREHEVLVQPSELAEQTRGHLGPVLP